MCYNIFVQINAKCKIAKSYKYESGDVFLFLESKAHKFIILIFQNEIVRSMSVVTFPVRVYSFPVPLGWFNYVKCY